MIRCAGLALVAVLASGCYHVGQLVHLATSRPDASAPLVYAERCRSCHGDAGRGDGPAGRSLEPLPRNFPDRTWQATTSDERIRLVIQSGGHAAGLSTSMAPHLDRSKEQLDALVVYIRAVGEN